MKVLPTYVGIMIYNDQPWNKDPYKSPVSLLVWWQHDSQVCWKAPIFAR